MGYWQFSSSYRKGLAPDGIWESIGTPISVGNPTFICGLFNRSNRISAQWVESKNIRNVVHNHYFACIYA